MWPNLSPMTKPLPVTLPFNCDQVPNHSPVTKSITYYWTVHPWPVFMWHFLGPLWLWHFLGPLYDCDTSWDISMIVALPGASMTVTLPGSSLWLWHFLGPFFDCGISWGPCPIVTLPGPLYDCDTSWSISLTGTSWSLYDCDPSWGPLWLWHFLGLLYDCDTSWGLSLIVTFPWAFLWVWYFLWRSYDCASLI